MRLGQHRQNMPGAVDRKVGRQFGDVARDQFAARIEDRGEIKLPHIAGEAQLNLALQLRQRPINDRGGLGDEDSIESIGVAPHHLRVDQHEHKRDRRRYGEREYNGEPERPAAPKIINRRPHRARNPDRRRVRISDGSPGPSILRRSLPI